MPCAQGQGLTKTVVALLQRVTRGWTPVRTLGQLLHFVRRVQRTRGLPSSTFRLNVGIFCGIRWVHDFPSLLDRGTRGGVTKTAWVELKNGRV
jgi:hypothetical protein